MEALRRELDEEELAMLEMEGWEDDVGEEETGDGEDGAPVITQSDLDGDVVADEDTRDFARDLARAVDSVKAEDVRVYDVSTVIYWTSMFVLASGFSQPQLDAMVDRCQKAAAARGRPPARQPEGRASWVLLDYGDVVVHIFTPAERAYYDLEEFYGDAKELPL